MVNKEQRPSPFFFWGPYRERVFEHARGYLVLATYFLMKFKNTKLLLALRLAL